MTPTLSPWPADADAVVSWVRALMSAPQADLTLTGLDGIRVSADLDAGDLSALGVDATGVRIGIGRAPDSAAEAAEPAVVRSRPAVARAIRLLARPVRIEDIPITADLIVNDVPISWVDYDAEAVPGVPESIHGIDLRDDGRGTHGSVDLSMRTADVAPLLRALLEPALTGGGVRLTRLDVDVRGDHERLTVTAHAGGRWKLLGGSIRGSAVVSVSPDAVVTVHDLRVGSANPLMALALLFARRPIRDAIGTTHDLNDGVAELGGARIHGVRVDAGDELRIRARLGQA